MATYTTTEVGRMCGVDTSTVVRWVRCGHLEAYATPGGHRRISDETLRRFLDRFRMPVPPALAGRTPARILIVDDEPDIIEIISRAVRMEDPEVLVESATEGFSACVKAGVFQPDLILLDLVLPGLDGPAVCRAVRSMPQLRHTRVVAITGYPDDERVAAVLAAGAERCLAKPLRVDDLRALVRRPAAAEI